MNILEFPERASWSTIIKRPAVDHLLLNEKVANVLNGVKKGGDKAVQQYTLEFDGVNLDSCTVTAAEIQEAINILDPILKKAIETAAANIQKFHLTQMNKELPVETMPGITCWRKWVGIDKVGLYIPGGSAPLFSTILMLGIPAEIAGCKQVVLCSPPDKNGKLHPAILYAANLVGIKQLFKIGGVQAIAAMAFGTETIPAVYKIFGPGNQYVTAAKQMVQQSGVAIDMPAGPSEVCVLADETAVPAFVAADLLSQAEHGPDSQVLLVSTSAQLIESVNQSLVSQIAELPRKDLAVKALQNSRAVLMNNMTDAVELVNEYAAEHLIIACSNANDIADQISNAGSVFIGNYSPESVGDYASGTNHTLPTNAYARMYSGVSVDSFIKKITFQQLTKEGLAAIANTVETMAEAEGLKAHAEAVRVRLK
ncbi:MAG: histidinol dehydrogenase [Sediminibacterium sp.]|nr:histidinol dehydrogenase [Sediminibacterium sp.]MDO8996243.1 histidinol dehydrogenase [Sediminibacterium sp.]MDP1971695.1 histidinol dehydrogenase [Sediminibacterium sp.]MDP2420960.1 histidinol dehydrogenase [Sediminibacterium sp.]